MANNTINAMYHFDHEQQILNVGADYYALSYITLMCKAHISSTLHLPAREGIKAHKAATATVTQVALSWLKEHPVGEYQDFVGEVARLVKQFYVLHQKEIGSPTIHRKYARPHRNHDEI